MTVDEDAKKLHEKFNEMIKDKETRIKLIELVKIRQEERFLQYERRKLKDLGDKIDRDLSHQYDLSMTDTIVLESIMLDTDYKALLEEFGEKWKKKMEEKDVRPNGCTSPS